MACTIAPAQITIATRGEPADYTIVLPAQASPAQHHAGRELQRFTEEMTGVRLPIISDAHPLPEHAIVLGSTRHTETILESSSDLASLGPDGFRITTKPPHLLIIGGPERGTLYGVYETLEQFAGCRWYSSWHHVIPQLESWTLPEIDQTQRPAFSVREPLWFDCFHGDWAARNKINGSRMELGAHHGGKVRFGRGLFVHTFNTLCPPSEFFDHHPEYFSEVDGKRIHHRTQLCLTNPAVVRIVTQRLLEHIREDPEAKLFSVSQNDWGNPCTCSYCKAIDDREGSHAGSLIHFVNQVATAVEKEFPDVWIETLAYQYTRTPPKTVRPRHNVVPRLCSIECDFSQPLAVSNYPQNESFVSDLRGWSKISHQLFIWDYTTNYRHYLAPFPNVLSLQKNIQLFRDQGVVGLLEQGAYQGRHADFAELKGWLLSKWMWNPDLPAEPLIDDFFSGYYGAAAPFVRRYFDELHSFYDNPKSAPLRIYYHISDRVIPDAFYARAAKLWQQAEAAVHDSPAHLYNVRMGALPVLYTQLMRMPNPDQIKIWVTEAPQLYQAPATRHALATEVLKRMDEAGDIRLSEAWHLEQKSLNQWRHWAATPKAPSVPAPQTKALVEDTVLDLTNRGVWGDTISDNRTNDGYALKLFNSYGKRPATLDFHHVAFDHGKTYRLRIRLRGKNHSQQNAPAFTAGIYDPRSKSAIVELKPESSSTDYAWYQLEDWIPEDHHIFWIAPARDPADTTARPAVYLDKIEILRVD
ncbi:DUF4838 domain-containing protein [Sulfuriroseicoccus oceanibius]|uniref:DUF4838 domain-containing protein n=1 Tax=Sulfuriroseicoccus oceanibius TaxID=2707525 RepID=A0A7T7EZX6_9BACT|nr:DUF4838 domain-containing protein [Sulfuriroseicoccus oceanibius]QQL44163.1 DUF4838 domain-containing protein [Sulfuriroseicoccus oceanibius]